MDQSLLANDRTGDPAHPERYPQRYVKVACAACKACWFDTRIGRCFSLGPYDADLQVSQNHCRRL